VPKRKLLLISYLFPPAGGITVQRALSFTRYLPAYGIDVHVLHARNAPTPVVDRSLLDRVPQDVKIHSAFTPEPGFRLRHFLWGLLSPGSRRPGPQASASGRPSAVAGGGFKGWAKDVVRRILCPEPEILWVPFAVRAARRIVRQENIEAVMVTAPPFSAFLVATRLKKEFPGLKVVADFRDEWLDFYLNENEFQSGEYVRKRATEIEREIVEASDLVIAVTDTSLDRIRKRYPELPDRRFVCIHNGFDPAQFADFRRRPHGTGKVVVTLVGTATNASSPRYYLDALDNAPAEVRERFETRFVGRIADRERPMVENRKADLRLLGFLPQKEATRYMEETDYLLLTMTDMVSLPGKLFEYLATGRPVLAITPPGSEVAKIFAATRAGICADPGDPADMQRALRQMAERPPEELCPAPDWDLIRSYERPRKAEQLASRIHALFE